jgi:hygromycin-B 7''-O-kinase
MPEILMPAVETLEAYRAIYHRDDIWEPVIEAICRRYPYLNQPCMRGPDGSHIVYFVGQAYVIKLFVPLFAQDFIAENLVARHLSGKIALEIPEIVAEGQIAGWNYLVMTRIFGTPLQFVWDDLLPDEQHAIASDVGRMITFLRTVPISGLDFLGSDWSQFLAAQIAGLTTHHQPVPELTWDLQQEFPAFFDSLEGIIDQPFQPVLLLADITREHTFVERCDRKWQVVGYLDFGDAMLGHPDYEMVAPGLEIAGGDPMLLRSLLTAAGYPENTHNQRISRRLLAYTLIHRYVDLAAVLSMVPQARNAASLDELAHLVWPLSR